LEVTLMILFPANYIQIIFFLQALIILVRYLEFAMLAVIISNPNLTIS